MRMIVFFDLPVDTSAQLRDYTRFRKFLIKSGFVMMQKSVYSKIVLNNTACEAMKERIRKNKSKEGLIQLLVITEKQFAQTEFIIGTTPSEVINSDEKLVIL